MLHGSIKFVGILYEPMTTRSFRNWMTLHRSFTGCSRKNLNIIIRQLYVKQSKTMVTVQSTLLSIPKLSSQYRKISWTKVLTMDKSNKSDPNEKKELTVKSDPPVQVLITKTEKKDIAANIDEIQPTEITITKTESITPECKAEITLQTEIIVQPKTDEKSDTPNNLKVVAKCQVPFDSKCASGISDESVPDVNMKERKQKEIKDLKDSLQSALNNEAENKQFLEKTKNLIVQAIKATENKLEDSKDEALKIVKLNQSITNTDPQITSNDGDHKLLKKRQKLDLNTSSLERNFITPVRAMTDFLLKPSDLEGLRKTKRRSPYENEPPITVYWRKDVETKALEVWGSKENLLKEILKRDIDRRRYQQNIFTVKRRLRDYRREQGRETELKQEEEAGLFGSSGRVVLTAIVINGSNFLFKLLAWCYTGSHSMFSEAVHSLADTVNQLILAYGIHKSVQRADSDHPYGYSNMKYVASLISGVGIFCVGSGMSMYHGVIGLTSSEPLESFYWAFFILGGSLVSEGATLLVAVNSIRKGARTSMMTFTEYVMRGQDPSVNVVLLEDCAAVLGVSIAATFMGLSSYLGNPIPDAIGSILVGGLLGAVASFIIYTNVAALVGKSIPQERLDKINAELEADIMIRAIHDVKGIDMGNSLVRYKAEMDFDGAELTRSYLDKQDLNQMLEEVKKMETIDELEQFLMKHGENIVDMMGGEIDRIELKLRKKHPEIRHCDLEIL